jgi:hypothetical protein
MLVTFKVEGFMLSWWFSTSVNTVTGQRRCVEVQITVMCYCLSEMLQHSQ